jgi:hypothetical protein
LALLFGENSRLPVYYRKLPLDELDVIERFDQPGRKPHIGEITQKQAILYACMGVNPPA